MRPAQISLTNYFVAELHLKINSAFNSQKPSAVEVEDLKVTKSATPESDDRRTWKMTLRVELGILAERNSPCSFAIDVIGSIQVDQSVKDENIDRLININGTSLLFSATREIIRAVTSRGPHRSILLPTVTFWEPKIVESPSEEKPIESDLEPAAAPGDAN